MCMDKSINTKTNLGPFRNTALFLGLFRTGPLLSGIPSEGSLGQGPIQNTTLIFFFFNSLRRRHAQTVKNGLSSHKTNYIDITKPPTPTPFFKNHFTIDYGTV